MSYRNLREKINEISILPHNKKCCECSAGRPEYANVTLGTFVCENCMKILYLFYDYSYKIKPDFNLKYLPNDDFTVKEVEHLMEWGNAVYIICNKLVNVVYLLNIPKEEQNSSLNRRTLQKFLERKYVQEEWKCKNLDPNEIRRLYNANIPVSIMQLLNYFDKYSG